MEKDKGITKIQQELLDKQMVDIGDVTLTEFLKLFEYEYQSKENIDSLNLMEYLEFLEESMNRVFMKLTEKYIQQEEIKRQYKNLFLNYLNEKIDYTAIDLEPQPVEKVKIKTKVKQL